MAENSAAGHAGHNSLTSVFNWHNLMNVSMLGMVAVMVAGTGAAPMLGDWFVQGFHMMWDFTVQAFTVGVPTGIETLSNLFNGEFMPTTYDMSAMHGAHGAHAAAGAAAATHAGHAACAPFDQWQSSLAAGDLQMMEQDASAYGMSLPDYYQNNLCHE